MNTTRQNNISLFRDGPVAAGVAAHHRHLDRLRPGEHHALFRALDELRDARGGQPGGGHRGANRRSKARRDISAAYCPTWTFPVRCRTCRLINVQAVPVGNAHFWLIGRGMNDQDPQTMAHFGLVDEASKMNVNYASSNMFADMFSYQPNADADNHRFHPRVAKHQHRAAERRGGIRDLHGFAAAVFVQELEVRDALTSCE